MKRYPTSILVIVALLLAAATKSFAQPILVTNNYSAAGQSTYDFGPVTVSAFYGQSATTPTAMINSGNINFLGVDSSSLGTDPNVNTVNDADGVYGGADQERLRLDIHTGYYLTNLTWNYSRADGPLPTDGVSISGFLANPGAVFSGGVSGTPYYTNGTLNFQITAFNSTVQTVWFTNYAASSAATLEIVTADSTQANAQFALRNFTVDTVPPPTPQITTQPVPATRYVQDGTNIFTVEATSQGTIGYQWYKSPSTLLPDATNASLTIPNLALGDAGNYYVVVTNSLGASTTSDTIALTVNSWTAPTFTTNPVSASAYANQTVSFSALATGSPAWSISYQWQKGGVPISGATNATLTLNNITSNDAGSYTCVADNGVGSPATSTAASLTLLTLTPGTYAAGTLDTKPLIYYRYSDVASSTNVFNYGSLAAAGDGSLAGAFYYGGSLNVGPEPPNYPNFETGNPCPYFDQFSVKGSIPPIGQVGNHFTITAWINSSGYQVPYTGIVYNRSGNGGSGLFVKQDSTASYNVLGYSWRGARYGITNDTLALPDNQWVFVALVIEPTQATLYVQNGSNMVTQVDPVNQGSDDWSNPSMVGWDSSAASRLFNGQIDEVTIHDRALSPSEVYTMFAASSNYPPSVVTSPQNATNYTGFPFSLSVAAQGTPPMSYQWYKVGSGAIAGATNDTYTVDSATLADSGDYYAVVTNLINSATSASATVTIVSQAPVFTSVPQSVTNWAGLDATFTAAAYGSGPMTYQWSKVGTGNLPGSTNTSLTLSNLTVGDSGDYYVTAINPVDSSNSPVATLTVLDANQYTQMLYPTNGYSNLRNNFNGVIGTSFQMGAMNRTVTHLGFFDDGGDGLLESHSVGIFAQGSNPGGGTLLADVTIPAGTGAGYTNGYRWVALSTPLVLTNGQHYVIAASTSSGTDLWPNNWQVDWNPAYVGYTSSTNEMIYYQVSASWPTEPGGVVNNVFGTSYGAYNLMSVPTSTTPVTLNVQRLGADLQLSWSQGTLQSATNVAGPYTDMPAVPNPYTVPTTNAMEFFRVKN